MAVFWFVVSAALFVGSFLLFGYAFEADAFFAGLGWTGFPFESVVFSAGIIAVVASLAIPFHLLGRSGDES